MTASWRRIVAAFAQRTERCRDAATVLAPTACCQEEDVIKAGKHSQGGCTFLFWERIHKR